MLTTRTPSSDTSRRSQRFSSTRTAILLAGLMLAGSATAGAAPIASTASCIGQTCYVEPIGGPLNVAPAGFSLDLAWPPQYVELLGVMQAGDWWALILTFTFTGTHDGTESWGVITLLDCLGLQVPGINPQFDDSNAVGNTLSVNYQIFNAGADFQSYIVQGLQLASGDGSGVATMQFVSARFSPAAVGTKHVPAPPEVLLLCAGVVAAGVRRLRTGRR